LSESVRFIAMIGALAFVVVLANYADKRSLLRAPLRGILLMLNILYVANYVLNPGLNTIPKAQAMQGSVIAVLFGVATTLLLSDRVRLSLVRFFPRRAIDTTSGQLVGFDPMSNVHMVALIYCLYLMARTILVFVLSGGLGGMAQDFEGVTLQELWISVAVFTLFALVGVGAGIRRHGADTLRRLGLRAPTLAELGMSAAMAFFLFGLAYVIGIVWQILTPRDVFEQQTVLSNQIAQSVNTLMLGFLLACAAAIGEEIAFRGALQPIFGLVPTAIIFAAIHGQYTFTPASLLIFFVALGFGWLRRKYNTTTAIVAHFLYNFSLVALAIMARYLLDTQFVAYISQLVAGIIK
jgi:membrane protease YdiL (CAAX protease family)